tara:strand:- start:3952 stop:4551 length:600 start_codon:yes stop_codon:yes gene_type:complete
MVNKENETDDIELEVTNEEQSEIEDSELVDVEEKSGDKIKKQKGTIDRLKEEKKQLQDELQRAKAEFLNARKRLDEERSRDRVRYKMQHVEELLPLCDSFQMAMSDQEAWERADEAWRKGVEGIHTQLKRLLDSYSVVEVDPIGETFDPHKHEAIGTEPVEDKKLQDTVVTVVQKGYEIKMGETTELIRPARVTTGELK